MRFLPLSYFKDYFQSTSDLFEEEKLNQFLQKLNEVKTELIVSGKFSEADLTRFISGIQDQNTLLFYSWIDLNKRLEQSLIDPKNLLEFTDSSGVLKHRLLDDFKIFISPFLANALLTVDHRKLDLVEKAVSYNVILDEDHQGIVENHLFDVIKEDLKHLDQYSYDITSEQELINHVKPLCSDQHFRIINGLSKSSYAYKLMFLEILLRTIESQGATIRYANWVLKELEKLKLNKEHQEKIREFGLKLRDGEIRVRNNGQGKTPIRWQPILLSLLFLIIAGSTYYIINYKPFSSPEDDITTINTSSFKEFTKEERMMIDSLVKEMDGNKSFDGVEVDPGYFYDDGTNIKIVKKNPNNLMQSIKDDFNKDASYTIAHYQDSCGKPKSYVPYSGVKSLEKRAGDLLAHFRNESEYDAIIYVAEGSENGNVYSMFMEKTSSKVIELKVGDLITMVVGNTYTSYSVPENANEGDLPSEKFKHHFCDVDINYEESINTSYIVKNSGRTDTKFMIVGEQNNFVRLVDIYSVLESY